MMGGIGLYSTELGFKASPRLRELALPGMREAGFTQPKAHFIAHLCFPSGLT